MTRERDDPKEGTGVESAYDGQAVAHLLTEAGQAEVDAAELWGQDDILISAPPGRE